MFFNLKVFINNHFLIYFHLGINKKFRLKLLFRDIYYYLLYGVEGSVLA
jgi:hypothetical protein